MRYKKSALISDELYSTDKFIAHNGNLRLADYREEWNNLERMRIWENEVLCV